MAMSIEEFSSRESWTRQQVEHVTAKAWCTAVANEFKQRLNSVRQTAPLVGRLQPKPACED